MTAYTPLARRDAWHGRDLRQVRRLLDEPDPSPTRREDIAAILDGYDAPRPQPDRSAARLAQRRSLHEATGRALSVALAGGDGLGEPPPLAWVADGVRGWLREGVELCTALEAA